MHSPKQPKISFFNHEIRFQIKHKKLLTEWIQQTIVQENKQPGKINVILCADGYLHQMNVQYLQHDTLTDIITFDYSENEIVSGELFISIERVKENAGLYSKSFFDELHRVIIHGVLHLCGYHDKNKKEMALMREKEDVYLLLRPEILRV
jgi:probable rRNA maturation factor